MTRRSDVTVDGDDRSGGSTPEAPRAGTGSKARIGPR